MSNDDAVSQALETVLPRRLSEFQRVTGLPVVFGGATRAVRDGRQLTITQRIGTFGDSLRLLSVLEGRGLGGAAMSRQKPCRVNNYATTSGITHDYDHVVVEHEQLMSMLAYPILIKGSVRGVIYGALREDRPIGDSAVGNAGAIVSSISKEVTALSEPFTSAPEPLISNGRAAAMDELAQLARLATEPGMRATLDRIHRALSQENAPRAAAQLRCGVTLTRREVEALKMVEAGATNADIAGRLGITVDTVKSYMYSAMRKLDASNRTRAVLAARGAGLL